MSSNGLTIALVSICLALFIKVGKKGKAVGIDHIKELVDMAQSNIENDSPELLESGTIELHGEMLH